MIRRRSIIEILDLEERQSFLNRLMTSKGVTKNRIIKLQETEKHFQKLKEEKTIET